MTRFMSRREASGTARRHLSRSTRLMTGAVALAALTACANDSAVAPTSVKPSLAVDAAGARATDGRIVFAADSLAPDGTLIARSALFVMNGDGTGLRRITPHHGYVKPQWSPDGRRIAFVLEGATPTSTSYVGVMNANGKSMRLITIGREPSWSPDGQRLVFDRNSGAIADVFIINADGTNEVQLTSSTDASEHSASWSADGQTIAYVRDTQLGIDIFAMEPDGDVQRKLVDCGVVGAFCEAPTWSPIPGDNRIAYVAFDLAKVSSSVRISDANGGAPVIVVPELFGAGRPAWSPQADRLVFASRAETEGLSALLVADIASGAVSTLTSRTTDEVDPSWRK